MRTNKIAILAVCLALLASCKKDNNTDDNAPENGFRATIEQPAKGGGSGGRTHINPDWGNETATSVYWTEDDLIKVANQNGSGSVLIFGLDEGKNTTNGIFYTGELPDGFFEPDYMAIYPAANAENVANTISGTTATFNMLSTQHYKVNTFDEGAMPMVASSSTQTLDFYNVFGGLCIPLIGDGLTVTSVRLTSLNTSDRLWGVFTADCTSSTPVPTHVSGGSRRLTLDCGEGVTLDATTPTDFYFMLPPGTMESGFTVTAYNGTTKIYEATADWTATPVTGMIPRSVVKKVNTNLEAVVEPLEVRTVSPTFITTNSAYGLGQVTSDPDNVFDRFGFLYMKYDDLANPGNVETELVVNGTNVLEPATVTEGGVSYGADLTALDLDTRYYVRAYAVDAIGRISYGDPILFATRRDYYAAGPYQGVMKDASGMPYEFTVAPGKQVYFSTGNLQYQASTNTWRFAEYQYEYVATGTSGAGNYRGLVFTGGMYPSGDMGIKCSNEKIKNNYTGWIDLFGWGTSGQDHGAECYQPWSTETYDGDYNAYGNATAHLDSQTPSTADWGYNAISNGGNTVNSGWRTMQAANTGVHTHEWDYLLNNASGPRSDYRFAMVTLLVRGTSNKAISTASPPYAGGYSYPACGRSNTGMIVFPDSFTTWPEGVRSMPCNRILSTHDYTEVATYLTEAEWSLLEQEGCVILPVCGVREDFNVYDIMGGSSDPLFAHYWSASMYNEDNACVIEFNLDQLETYYGDKYRGCAVRLVRDAN